MPYLQADSETVAYLLAHGARHNIFSAVSVGDVEAWHTPLAYAVLRDRKEIARLLIERGADAILRSPASETLSEIARKAGHHELALVIEALSPVDRQSSS